ncbi:hypothetical protein FRC17_008833 [Serendipita sp. 399]|nr:hypothetical protein FRC17_008833 [Serendipita sp. 399]
MNSVLVIIEFLFGRVRLYLGYWIVCIIVLALYLGMAYLVHETQNIWVYNFLDPHKENAHVAAYIVGIPVAETVVFIVMWGLIHIRDWILPRGKGVRVVTTA